MVRELLQNAIDTIDAVGHRYKLQDWYRYKNEPGEVLIELVEPEEPQKPEQNNSHWRLIVADKGVGAWQRLDFPNGLSLRPIQSQASPGGKLNDYQTVVEVVIAKPATPNGLDKDETFPPVEKTGSTSVNHFNDCIGRMLCDRRVNVRTQTKRDNSGRPVDLGRVDDWGTLQALEFLRLHTEPTRPHRFSTAAKYKKYEAQIQKLAKRFRPIKINGRVRGFAAVHTSEFMGMKREFITMVDGITQLEGEPENPFFIGWIDHYSGTAARTGSLPLLGEEAVASWRNDQLSQFWDDDPSYGDQFGSAPAFHSWGIDCCLVMKPLFVRVFRSNLELESDVRLFTTESFPEVAIGPEEVATKFANHGLIIIASHYSGRALSLVDEENWGLVDLSGFNIDWPTSNGKITVETAPELFASDGSLYAIHAMLDPFCENLSWELDNCTRPIGDENMGRVRVLKISWDLKADAPTTKP